MHLQRAHRKLSEVDLVPQGKQNSSTFADAALNGALPVHLADVEQAAALAGVPRLRPCLQSARHLKRHRSRSLVRSR